MQATAAVETASGDGSGSDGGHSPKDEPSNPKKGNLSSSSGYNEARLTFHDDDWYSLAQDQIADDEDVSTTDQMDSLELSPPASADASLEGARPRPWGSEGGVGCVLLNETYSVHSTESKLKNENGILLNSELASEMQKSEELFFDVLEHNMILGLERSYKISDVFKEAAEGVWKRDTDGDSQRGCRGEEEQEHRSSRFSFSRAETASLADLEVVGLKNSGYEGKHTGNPEANHVRLESSSSISLDSVDVYGQEELPHASKFQNSVTLSDYHRPKHEKCKEQETSLMYHTVCDEIVLSSNPPENQESQSNSSFLNPRQALKTKIYTGKIKSQVSETKDFCGTTTVENTMSQHLENPTILPEDGAVETLPQPCKDTQTSCPLGDDSALSPCDRSHYVSLPGTPDSALGSPAAPPGTGVGHAQQLGDGSLEVTAGQTFLLGVEGRRPGSVTAVPRRALTVSQTVDVSSDFRACFTTSRATTARPPVVSTSSNTEITMMNKKRPGECQKGKHRSVACNTDWSYCPGSEDTQLAVTKGPLGKAFSVNSVKPNGNVLDKDSLELRKTLAITDLKKHPEREPQLSKDREKSLPSQCCRKIMQRAVQAELQLLNVHYQGCRRHCSEIYRLAMEDREGFSRDLSTHSVHKELGSALLSVLGDLKVKYVSLREKINQGAPLGGLPPLSVESRLLSAFSAFAARLMKKESHVFSGADSELDNQIICDVDISSSLKKTLSQVSLVSDNSHPDQGSLPKEDGLKNGDIDRYFSHLKLDDKDYENHQEVSEDWFDAKESLTGADCSGDSRTEHDTLDPECAPEIKTVDSLQREKSHLVHVGGLCPSVSEADLRYHFQKYQVSEISVYDSSNYRYASLAFKRNSDAKSAVNEMNGIEINGKSVNVRLVKSPGECTSPLSSKNGRRVSLNNLEKSTSRETSSASCISRLPRTRPRQLGSEEDSESFHFDQGVKKKNCKQIESTKPLADTPLRFMPPDTLNLRSFTKIVRRLAELHPDVCRDRIIDALQAVRINHKGFLNGLSINTIVEMTSSVLKNSTST